jgi:hypothetical protein
MSDYIPSFDLSAFQFDLMQRAPRTLLCPLALASQMPGPHPFTPQPA